MVKGYYVSLLKKVIVLYLQIDKFTLGACVRASQMAPETLTCHQAVFLFSFFFCWERKSVDEQREEKLGL